MLGLATDVVALYVDRNGAYPKRVAECFDERRDARTYAGDLPVIAHPPCQRWCRLAGLVEARWGHKRGQDGGLFAHALETLRRCGGVLEHPAYSDAWAAHGLPRPVTGAGWCDGAEPFEWTCYVEQYQYGHLAKKATWLYYVGAKRPGELRWSVVSDAAAAAGAAPLSWTGNKGRTNWRDNVRPALVSYAANHPGHRGPAVFNCSLAQKGQRGNVALVERFTKRDNPQDGRQRLTKKQANATPPDFLEVLLRLARGSRG